MRIYVATSWKNAYQPAVVDLLRREGHDVYDFRNPAEGDHGFHWSAINGGWKFWTARDYISALSHPIAVDGFEKDMTALRDADLVVLVLPCGRSAHLELGWAVGAGKRSIILLDGEAGEPVTPELMYRMDDDVVTTFEELVDAVRAHAGGLRPKKEAEPSLPVERVRQPLTAILGRIELALDGLSAAEELFGSAYDHRKDSPGCDVLAAYEAAKQLAAMCSEAEHATRHEERSTSYAGSLGSSLTVSGTRGTIDPQR